MARVDRLAFMVVIDLMSGPVQPQMVSFAKEHPNKTKNLERESRQSLAANAKANGLRMNGTEAPIIESPERKEQ